MVLTWTLVSSNHCGLGYPNFNSWCLMFSWVCQFLSAIHYTLFHNNDPFYLSNWEGSTFFLGSWSWKCFSVFEALLQDYPTLIHVNPSKPFVLEMDAFDFALGVVFSQLGEDNLFHPIGFHFRKFNLVEINYKIHDKELLAIVDAFEEWCHLLERAQHEITMYSYHKNLQYFMTVHVLSQRQAQWALSLSWFQFVITYCPRQQQGKPYVLFHHLYLTLKKGDAVYDQQCDTIIKPKNL